MTTAYNNKQKIKFIFYAVFICLILLVFDVVKLNYRYTADEIIYNGYFGHQSAINYAYSHSISGTK